MNKSELNSNFLNNLQFNNEGLIPAIAQDHLDGAILMMAWMNQISIERTINTGFVHYWSRSRSELWLKGNTSGNKQILKEIKFDCDADTILLKIDQTGSGACHKGYRSCFFNSYDHEAGHILKSFDITSDTCSEVFKIIERRKNTPEKGSYTNSLLEGGTNKILKKIGEESAEFVMSCKDNDTSEIANEAADLIFHLQVALSSQGVSWREVLKVLESRKGAPRRHRND